MSGGFGGGGGFGGLGGGFGGGGFGGAGLGDYMDYKLSTSGGGAGGGGGKGSSDASVNISVGYDFTVLEAADAGDKNIFLSVRMSRGFISVDGIITLKDIPCRIKSIECGGEKIPMAASGMKAEIFLEPQPKDGVPDEVLETADILSYLEKGRLISTDKCTDAKWYKESPASIAEELIKTEYYRNNKDKAVYILSFCKGINQEAAETYINVARQCRDHPAIEGCSLFFIMMFLSVAVVLVGALLIWLL